ncbi:unnamed protein product [Miscanthus lutarioriparius]|uniref:Uncharacterized protein n=1 Tax=Miscanthus lutarioriparius TaxID=422564 RepID=A0A811M989_9POAL|nr:unnamed protein product [Miscanthus lutarioriparius]
MGVLNWMQTKLHGSHRNRRRSAEFSAGMARPADASGGLPQTDKLNDGWTTAMMLIGTFGTRGEGNRVKGCGRLDELSKLQEELKSLAGARRAATAGGLDRVNHLQLERLLSCSSTSRNGGIGRPRSFRALATRPSEIVWGLLLKKVHPENPAFSDTATRDDQVVQMAPKGKVEAEDEGGKWIRTDSQYIVLEI